MIRRLLVLLLPLATLYANALEEVEINGIYYYLQSNSKEASVTSNSKSWYSGNIIIPDTVIYEGEKYSVTSIGNCAFQNCIDVTSVIIPKNVTSIGTMAFQKCTNLTQITIPDKVKEIDWCAFAYCENLTSVTIPNSVTTIGLGAFEGCSSLTSVTIPDGIEYIQEYVFAHTGITSITIPSSVTYIGYAAFDYNLKEVYCLAENVPKADHNAFRVDFRTTTLHVPEQSISAYKTISPWRNFENIVGIGTGISKINNIPIQIHQVNGNIIVEGGEEGTMVSVYDVKGVQLGNAIIEGGRAFIPTNLKNDNVAIIKNNENSIKVIIKY